MAAATGEDVVDWSCTGKTSKSVLPRIDAAIEVGDIRPSTKAIYLAIGGNDFGLYGLGEGNNPADPAAMRAQYSAHLATTGEKIRAVAPGAKIIVTGLPQASNGTTLCVLSVIRNAPVGIPFPGEAVEPAIRDMQRAGAEANGMEFVDNYAMTAGHDTCAPEEQRYVSGLIDTTTPGVTMLLHPTVAGHKVLARNNYAAL